jgi:hypothetical protein
MGRKAKPKKRTNWGKGSPLKRMNSAVRKYNTGNLKLSIQKIEKKWNEKEFLKQQNKLVKQIVADNLFGEGKSTLRRLVGLDKSRETKKKASGAPKALSEEEEEELVQWITDMDALSMPPNQEVVKAAALSICSNPRFKASKKWFQRFRKDHPKLNFRTPEVTIIFYILSKSFLIL